MLWRMHCAQAARTALGGIEALEQRDNGGFASTARATESEHLPGRRVQREAGENWAVGAQRVVEMDVTKLEVALAAERHDRVRWRLDGWLALDPFDDRIGGANCLRKRCEDGAELFEC